MSDTDDDTDEWLRQRREIDDLLARNRQRRNLAQWEGDQAHEELQAILVRGQNLGRSVAGMARAAGISRDTAHRLLREAGSVSLRRRPIEADEDAEKHDA